MNWADAMSIDRKYMGKSGASFGMKIGRFVRVEKKKLSGRTTNVYFSKVAVVPETISIEEFEDSGHTGLTDSDDGDNDNRASFDDHEDDMYGLSMGTIEPNVSMTPSVQPVKKPVKKPVKEAVKEPVKEAVKKPVKGAVKEPVKPVKEAVKEPVKEPVKPVKPIPKGKKSKYTPATEEDKK
jgi:hypothetical protein